MAGWCFEILFTGTKHGIHSKGKDWTLHGKSYIWMLPIYGLAAFLFEPLHNSIRDFHWLLRGLIYATGIFAVEFLTGSLLRTFTGQCPWDYSEKRFHLRGLIRWDYAPIWFFLGLGLEQLHDLLMRVRVLQ
jgi:uncharacterized membrane protein